MANFIRCFVRSGPDAWRCVAPALIDLPTGHIEVAIGCVLKRGTKFMNVDVVELLERADQEEHEPH